jgi:hypothetical protein
VLLAKGELQLQKKFAGMKRGMFGGVDSRFAFIIYEGSGLSGKIRLLYYF